MPDFSKAAVTTDTTDLTAYRTFLRKLTVGQAVILPLEPGETSRKVMRHLNAAAAQSNLRLARLPAEDGSVRFRVRSGEKREINISEEAKRARVEKAKATRAARQAERAQVQAMGMPAAATGPSAAAVVTEETPTTPTRRRRAVSS